MVKFRNTRILFLADANSPHTIRWVDAILNSDFNIAIFCLHKIDQSIYSEYPNVKLYSLNISRTLQSASEDNISKIVYFRAIGKVREIIREFKPDIVHSHYASSYGFIGALSGFHPYIISMWGSDIFGFPNYSVLHKSVLKFNLSKADKLLSTSKLMKIEAKKFTNKDIVVTPFGIDVNKFKPRVVRPIFEQADIVIGTIKTMEKIYGIEFLIKAFRIVKNHLPDKQIKLLIVGEGTQREKLEQLTSQLNLSNDTIFTGYIDQSEVDIYHNMLDIYVAVSLQESFGVAILEASACCKPVIVSNVGGLPEVVDNYATGLIVEKENEEQLAEALLSLVNNPGLRINMGLQGRIKVINEFNWQNSITQMISIYDDCMNLKSE